MKTQMSAATYELAIKGAVEWCNGAVLLMLNKTTLAKIPPLVDDVLAFKEAVQPGAVHEWQVQVTQSHSAIQVDEVLVVDRKGSPVLFELQVSSAEPVNKEEEKTEEEEKPTEET